MHLECLNTANSAQFVIAQDASSGASDPILRITEGATSSALDSKVEVLSTTDSSSTTTGSAILSGGLGVAKGIHCAKLAATNVESSTSLTCDWAGAFSGAVTSSCSVYKIGEVVHVSLGPADGTSDATNFTSDAFIPAAFRPTTDKDIVGVVSKDSAGSTQVSKIVVGSNGTLQVYNGLSSATWTASGTKSIGGMSARLNFSCTTD